MKSRKTAFTLIEICMVVLIIGILVAIAVPNLITARNGATTKACIANLSEIDSAKEMLRIDLKLDDAAQPTQNQLVPTYLKNFPKCPMNGTYQINDMNTLPTCTLSGHVLTF